jgi:EAL domain-containing protein (putative c-di-GMP-specific phosphodiesterase class I)/GGDEF domain-containing protein
MSGELDGGLILASLESATYRWTADDDWLAWWPHPPAGLNTADAARGDQWAALTDPDAISTRTRVVTDAAARDAGTGVPYELEYALRLPGRGGARLVWVEDIGRCYAGTDGLPARAEGIVRLTAGGGDVLGTGPLHSRLDALTGTLARPRLLDTLAAMIHDAQRFQTSCGVLLIAVETPAALRGEPGFDDVLAAMGRRLRASMRDGDAIGRFSDDVFALALANCTLSDLSVAARRLIDAAQGSTGDGLDAGAPDARVSCVGLVAPRHAETVADAVARLSEALAELRSDRRGGCVIYAPNPHRDEARRAGAALADDLVEAIDGERLTLLFQPVIDARTGEIAWHEALARIRDAEGAERTISGNIEAAERMGFVHLLDHRVLELALSEVRRNATAKVAVNVSARTLDDPQWSGSLISAVEAEPGLAHRLLVEITETAAPGAVSDALSFVEALRACGIRVALDDFGAGQTSFRALRRLGVDLVKIDGDFISGLADSAQDRAYVRTILALARDVGFRTVAERVETRGTADLLIEWGVDYLQGDFYGAAGPLPNL